jgi:hypothetical protein
MTTPTKKWNRLPEKTELELLKILSNPKLKQQPFYSLCDRDKTLFGEKNSELRRRVINARNYLNKNPAALVKKLEKFARLLAQSPDSVIADPPLFSPRFPSPHYPLSSHSSFILTSPPSQRQPSNMASDGKIEIASASSFDIYLTEPWMNGDSGVFVLYAERAKFNDAWVCLRIDLYVPIVDIADYYEGRYKVCLSADFTTIEWLVPSIHGYFHGKHKYVQDTAGKEYEDPLIVARHKESAPNSVRSQIPPNTRTPTFSFT